MGFFNKNDINKGIAEYKNSKNAYLIDVRTVGEYKGGYIEGSINIPLDEIDKVTEVIKDKEANIFIHCRSGMRAISAKNKLEKLGYKNVKNIGGILDYKGEIKTK